MTTFWRATAPFLFLSIYIHCLNIEARLKFPEYCLYHGYPTETHTIHTADGYNLRFFRLQGSSCFTQPKTPR